MITSIYWLVVLSFFSCGEYSGSKKIKFAYASFIQKAENTLDTWKIIDTLEYSNEQYLIKSTHIIYYTDTTFRRLDINFDTLGNPIQYQSFNNSKLSSFKKNTYNEKHDLTFSFIIENLNKRLDTIRIKYIHLYKQKGEPFLAYKINNGDTVSKYTILETDSISTKKEESFQDEGYTWYKIEEKHLNTQGKPENIYTWEISSGYSDRSNLDTIASIQKFVYDSKGRVISEEDWENDKFIGKFQNEYENGGLKRKITNFNGVVTETNYNHIYYDD